MCLGAIGKLVETWEENGARLGRLEDGSTVPLAFVPAAASGMHVLIHLGIPVEALDEETARDALDLRREP